jgi:hypothetical protein
VLPSRGVLKLSALLSSAGVRFIWPTEEDPVHVGDLDLDGLALVAVVVLPVSLDELAGHEWV